MHAPNAILSVEERLEKARLLPRLNQEVVTMCKTVDLLLHAQHTSNLAQAIICVQELAREHYAVVIALKWVVLLVDMLESDTLDVRLASCNAISAVSMAQEGRDVVRSSGGLRPLVMLLAEGSRSSVAAAAAAALMNCSACDTCKEAIADCRGVPMLLGLIRDAVSRCNGGGGGAGGALSSSSSSADSARGGGGGGGGGNGGGGTATQDLRTPGECKAAVYAAGALMNMGGVISVQERLMEAGAVQVLESVLRVSSPSDVVATRANFMLSWLAVASSAMTGTLEPRSSSQDSAVSLLPTPRSLAPLPSINSSLHGSSQPSLRPAVSAMSGGSSIAPQRSSMHPAPSSQLHPHHQPSTQIRITPTPMSKSTTTGSGTSKAAVVAGHA